MVLARLTSGGGCRAPSPPLNFFFVFYTRYLRSVSFSFRQVRTSLLDILKKRLRRLLFWAGLRPRSGPHCLVLCSLTEDVLSSSSGTEGRRKKQSRNRRRKRERSLFFVQREKKMKVNPTRFLDPVVKGNFGWRENVREEMYCSQTVRGENRLLF